MSTSRDASAPHGSGLGGLLGPFYDTAGVATLLSCSPLAVEELREAGELLAMKTSDDVWVYPTFTLTRDGPRHDLRAVLAVFHRGGVDGWSVGVWLRTESDDLRSATPERWLAEGNDPDAAIRLAANAAFAWSA